MDAEVKQEPGEVERGREYGDLKVFGQFLQNRLLLEMGGGRYASERRSTLCASLILRTLGNLPGDHAGSQSPFGPIVGRLNSRIVQESN